MFDLREQVGNLPGFTDIRWHAKRSGRVYAGKFDRQVRRISRAAQTVITEYTWPGNVRELQHAIERAVILSTDDEVSLQDLPDEVRGQQPPTTPSIQRAEREDLDAIADERARLERALELGGGNRERAAELLGMSRTTLWRRMRKQGLLD